MDGGWLKWATKKRFSHPLRLVPKINKFFIKEEVIMAKKIQAWSEFRPRLEPVAPMTNKELIENIIAATNQSRGSVQAVLSELDVQIENALKSGRIIHLPNGTHFKPTGKKDGSVDIDVRVNPELDKNVNAGFRGKWINSANIGKSEEEMIAIWNEAHPDDLIEA